MRRCTCTPAERRRLRQQLHRTPDARVHRRTLAVLEVADGRPVPEVARQLDVDPSSVRGWLDRYEGDHDPAALEERPRSGRQRCWEDEDLEILDALLDHSPQELGCPASQWTVPLLQAHLERCGLPPCSTSTLRRYLDELDRVWKRARYTLEPDPQREKKKTHPKTAGAAYRSPGRAVRG